MSFLAINIREQFNDCMDEILKQMECGGNLSGKEGDHGELEKFVRDINKEKQEEIDQVMVDRDKVSISIISKTSVLESLVEKLISLLSALKVNPSNAFRTPDNNISINQHTLTNENELYLYALFDGCSENDFAMRSKCVNHAKFIESLSEVTIPVTILNCFCLSYCEDEVSKRPATFKILLHRRCHLILLNCKCIKCLSY